MEGRDGAGRMIHDDRIETVLEAYHERMRDERQNPRVEPPGGRDGGQGLRFRFVVLQTP